MAVSHFRSLEGSLTMRGTMLHSTRLGFRGPLSLWVLTASSLAFSVTPLVAQSEPATISTTIVVPAAPGHQGPKVPTPPPPPPGSDAWSILDGQPANRQEQKTLDRRNKDGRGDLLGGYREVLVVLGDGRVADAAAALESFERGSLAGRNARDLGRLFDAEVEVVRWLASRDPEALVPLMALHHRSFSRYVESGEPFLAAHASRISASLADLYARAGGTEGSRVLGARALATLGIRSQRAGMKNEGPALMLAALTHDPRSEAALLGIAAAHERTGGYEKAVEHLENLVRAVPDHREGLLRLGVNLARLEKTERAEKILRGLTRGDEDDWIAVLAFEELGRQLHAAGRFKDAQKVLETGLARFPGEGALRTVLVLTLDAQKLHRQALAVMEELPWVEPDTGASPRLLYTRGPQETFTAAESELAASAAPRARRLGQLIRGTLATADKDGGP